MRVKTGTKKITTFPKRFQTTFPTTVLKKLSRMKKMSNTFSKKTNSNCIQLPITSLNPKTQHHSPFHSLIYNDGGDNFVDLVENEVLSSL